MLILLSYIDFFAKLYIAAFIIRFHCSGYRLGYNPVVDFLVRITEPLTQPFRRLMPNTRFDSSVLLPALILSILVSYLPLHDRSLSVVILYGVLHYFLMAWTLVLFYAILLAVLTSWFEVDPRQQMMQVVLSCSEWLMNFLRSFIPPVAGLDFSPMVALILISLVQSGIASVLNQFFAWSVLS